MICPYRSAIGTKLPRGSGQSTTRGKHCDIGRQTRFIAPGGRHSYSAEPCVQMNDCASIMSRGPRSAWSPRMRRAKSSRLE